MSEVGIQQSTCSLKHNHPTRHWPGSCWIRWGGPWWLPADPQCWLWQTWPLWGSPSPSAGPRCAPSSSCPSSSSGARLWFDHCKQLWQHHVHVFMPGPNALWAAVVPASDHLSDPLPKVTCMCPPVNEHPSKTTYKTIYKWWLMVTIYKWSPMSKQLQVNNYKRPLMTDQIYQVTTCKRLPVSDHQ